MQSATGKTLLTQRSFDQTQMRDGYYNTPRKSMVNLSTTSAKNVSIGNLKEKMRIPMIRDKSAPGAVTSRRPTVTGQNEISLGKAKLKSLEEKYRKTIKKGRKNTVFVLGFIFDCSCFFYYRFSGNS